MQGFYLSAVAMEENIMDGIFASGKYAPLTVVAVSAVVVAVAFVLVCHRRKKN